MAEFGGESRRPVACTSRDVTVGETGLRRQIQTMLLQGACKRLDSRRHKFEAANLDNAFTRNLQTALQKQTQGFPVSRSRPAPLTYPRSSSFTYLHHAVPLTSCTSYVPSIFQCHSPASRLHVPAAPSTKRRIFSVPVTSSTPRVVAIPSFPTFSFLLHAHRILKWLWLLRQL